MKRVVVGAVVVATTLSACVLFGIAPVPCATDDDCPAGTCDAVVRQCVLGESAGEGEGNGGAEGEGGGPPLFTDEFSSEDVEWANWDCAEFDFISGFDTQSGGVGLLTPRNFSNMDCGRPNDVIVDVDMRFDVALDPNSEVFPGDPVAIGESPMASVRRHLVDGTITGVGFYQVDEIEAILTPVDDDTIHARFAHVHHMRRGHFEDIPVQAAAGAEIDVDLPLADPSVPVRVRVRVDGTSPTRMRMKVWSAALAEPTVWMIDANLADDADVRADDFGIALNVFADADPGIISEWDNVAIYDASTVSPDDPLAGP